MTRIATAASKQRKLVAVTGVIILAAALAVSLYLSKKSNYQGQAADALFRARSKLETEMKAVATSMNPPTASAKKDAKKEAPTPSIDYVKFSVDAKLPEGIAALKKVAESFPGTPAGFDAKMELGGLYFDHAENSTAYEQAGKWFESAAASAPSSDQTIAALYSLGFTQESLGKCADAVKTFDRAMNSGSGPLQSDILRAKARCQETVGDKVGAKATYESIIKLSPGSENARFAESKKASL
jgi:TolA-binding protein